jgi:hypothetical protein
VYAVPFLVLASGGIFCAVVVKRWGLNGVFTLLVASVLVIGGLVALATWRGWWGAIGHWLAGQSSLSLLAGWPVLLAAAGFLTIRRAMP